jgi:hypothetical protein
MRDRLIELMKELSVDLDVNCGDKCYTCQQGCIGKLADHLLESGVIVQAQGRWIEQSDGWGGVLYTCSACRCDWCTIDGTPVENNMRYCPECGAKMSDVIERSNENAE